MCRRFLTSPPNADVFTSMASKEAQGRSAVAVMLPTSRPKATIAMTSCVKRAAARVDRPNKARSGGLTVVSYQRLLFFGRSNIYPRQSATSSRRSSDGYRDRPVADEQQQHNLIQVLQAGFF